MQKLQTKLSLNFLNKNIVKCLNLEARRMQYIGFELIKIKLKIFLSLKNLCFFVHESSKTLTKS